MPKIFGLNLAPVVIATAVFWALGYLWYGVLFMDAWMAAHGLAADQAGGFDVYMAGGVLTTLMQVVGVGLVLKWRNAGDIAAAIGTALTVWFLFALPLVMYNYLYLPAHDSALLTIDFSYLLVGWVLTALVFALMK